MRCKARNIDEKYEENGFVIKRLMIIEFLYMISNKKQLQHEGIFRILGRSGEGVT